MRKVPLLDPSSSYQSAGRIDDILEGFATFAAAHRLRLGVMWHAHSALLLSELWQVEASD